MSVLNAQDDVAALTPLALSVEEKFLSGLKEIAGTLFAGYKVTITIEVSK